jgi:hypothetical protein
MSKIFLFVFLISTTFPFLSVPAKANVNACAELFHSDLLFLNSKSHGSDLRSTLKKILLNDKVLTDLDSIRRKYDYIRREAKMAATVQFLQVLAPYTDLIYDDHRPETEIKVLEIGMDNILEDLKNVSPRYVSTDRLLSENIAVIFALMAGERAKEMPRVKEGNVVSISNNHIRSNSEYIEARKIVFDFISDYRHRNFIPTDTLTERTEQLLLADIRYQTLDPEEKYTVANRVIQSLAKPTYEDIEIVLEKFYASRNKNSSDSKPL